MLELLALGLAAVVAICVLQLLANRTGLPAAALLTVAGLVYALLPGPNLTLNPQVILTLVIPPLIYSAALDSSLLAIRRNLRAVSSLSIGLVLATSLLTGIGLDLVIPGLGLAAGVALGAAVSPTDPVAALAVGGRVGLPARLITIIQGEGLLNDATALTTLTVAVTAATSGGFSLGDAVLRFLLAAAGGLVAGVVVAVAVRLARSLVRDPLLVNCISLVTPFAAYLLGEEAHVSGVLAVAVAGLMVGHDTPRFTSGASRLQVSAVWRLVDFLLQGFVFLLIGQQIVPVIRGLRPYPASTITAAVLVTVGVVLLLRPVWLILTQHLPGALHTRLGVQGPGRPVRAGPAGAGTVGAGDPGAELGRHPWRDHFGRDLHPAADRGARAAVPGPRPAAVLRLRDRGGHAGPPGRHVRADRAGTRRARRPGRRGLGPQRRPRRVGAGRPDPAGPAHRGPGRTRAQAGGAEVHGPDPAAALPGDGRRGRGRLGRPGGVGARVPGARGRPMGPAGGHR